MNWMRMLTMAVLSALVLGLASCGSDDDEGGGDGGSASAGAARADSATVEDDVRAAYETFVDGVYEANYEQACATISPGYLKKISPGTPCAKGLENAFRGRTPVAARPRILTVDVHGRTARLTAKSKDALRTSNFRLVNQGGKWLITRQGYSDS